MANDESFEPSGLAELEVWLEANGERTEGLWLITSRKATTQHSISYDEVVDVLLCYGWIDSKPGKVDEKRTKLWIAPRKARSGWSGVNKVRIERLLAEGRMHPRGLALIEAAKRDGSWTLLDQASALIVSEDLAAALAAYTNARGHFDAFPKSTRRAILEWIAQARKAETRARRVAETARLANDNLRANQWSR